MEIVMVKVRHGGKPVNVEEYKYLVETTEEDWRPVPDYIGRSFAIMQPEVTLEPVKEELS